MLIHKSISFATSRFQVICFYQKYVEKIKIKKSEDAFWILIQLPVCVGVFEFLKKLKKLTILLIWKHITWKLRVANEILYKCFWILNEIFDDFFQTVNYILKPLFFQLVYYQMDTPIIFIEKFCGIIKTDVFFFFSLVVPS